MRRYLFFNEYRRNGLKIVMRKKQMTEITAQMVKDLRESTSAGMLDCKKP